MVNFTFEDLHDLENNEKSIFGRIATQAEEIEISPKKSTVNNILAYSKALSVRDSKSLKKVKMILN
ncbi:MAG: hypothetical protein AAF487_01470 [Bacteroidota bacterium]